MEPLWRGEGQTRTYGVWNMLNSGNTFFGSSNTGDDGGSYAQPHQGSQQGDALDNGSQGQQSGDQGQQTQGQQSNPDYDARIQQMQQQLQQEQQWRQQLGRFLGGDPHGQAVDPRHADAQLKQLLNENPSALFNNLSSTISQNTEKTVQQKINETIAVNEAVSHFQNQYGHYADYGDVIELNVQQLVNEVQQQRAMGKDVSLTPTQVVDEAVKRFEQRFQGLQGQNQALSGSPYAMNTMDVGGMSPHRRQQSQQPQMNYWQMSDNDFAKARQQALSSSFA